MIGGVDLAVQVTERVESARTLWKLAKDVRARAEKDGLKISVEGGLLLDEVHRLAIRMGVAD